MAESEFLQSYITEIRRGSLIIAVLGSLKTPYYGYALLQRLQSGGVEIEANTLYPLLRRLESQGLLTSSWDTSESRPRKYYTINDTGRELYTTLVAQWRRLQNNIEAICKEGEDNV